MAQKRKPIPLEGVRLDDLMPKPAGSVLNTRRPKNTGLFSTGPADLDAELRSRQSNGHQAEDSIVDAITSTVPRVSLDGQGLATQKPGQSTPWDYVRAPWDAIKSEMFTYDIARWMFEDSQPNDPDFRWDKDRLDQYTGGLPEDQVDFVLEAESDEEAAKRLARVEEMLESRSNLANLGTYGSALSLTAGILDPVTWVSGGAGILAKGGRLARMAKGGMYASATAAGQYALFGQVSPVETEADALTAVAISFMLGSTIGGLRNPKAAVAAHDAAISTEVAGMERAGFKLTDAGKEFYREARSRFKRAAGMADEEDLPSGGPAFGGRSSAGAMERDGTLDTLRTDPITGVKAFDQLRSVEDEGFSWGGRLRLDVVGKLRQSLNPAVRNLAKLLDIDAVGVSKEGGVAHLGAAAERQRRYVQTVLGQTSADLSRIYNAYSKRQGWTFLQRHQGKAQFYSNLVQYLRSRGTMPDPGGDLRAAAEAWKTSMQSGLARLREAGVDGADRFEPDEWYVPRQWKSAKIEAAIAKFGLEKVEGLLAASLRSAWRKLPVDRPRIAADIEGDVLRHPRLGDINADDLDDLPADKADRIAKAMLNKVRRIGAGVETGGLDVTRHTREQLKDLLEEAGLEVDDVNRILDRIVPSKDSANFSRLKNRTTLDDGYSELARPRDGGTMEELSIHDLLEDDAGKILSGYHSGVGSYSAMSEIGLQSFGQFERLIQQTRAHVGTVKGYTAAMADADVRRLSYLGKRIFGVPVEDMGSQAARISKIARDINFARNMGQAGAANIADIAVVMAETGFKTVRTHLPAVMEAIRAMRRGDHVEGLDRELSTLLGVGHHSKRDALVPAYEDLDEMMLLHSARADWIGRVGEMANTASRVVGEVSGFNFVTDFLNLTAARASVQQIADMVMDVKKPSKGLPIRRPSDNLTMEPNGRMEPLEVGTRREEAWGITPDDKAAWKDLFLKAEFDKNGTILRMNFEKMREANPAAFQRLVDYLDRRVHTMVLEPTPGMLHEAFGTTVGKIFLQFRAFPFASTMAHTMQAVALRDRIAAQKLVYGMAAAGLIYTMQTHVRSVGRSDRQKYLKERLSWEEIAKASFQRSAAAGLTPSLIDTAYGTVSTKPMFAYGRTTELASGFVTGNPTVDLVSDMYSAVSAPGQSAFSSSRQYSEGDARTALSILPFQNVWGIQNALQIATSTLPERRVQEEDEE